MKKLYVFGDSYSTPGAHVSPKESWWGLAAQSLNVDEVMNYSWHGNTFDSIQHVIMNILPQVTTDDFMLIGVPPLSRLTYMTFPGNTRVYTRKLLDSNLELQDEDSVICHTGLTQKIISQCPKDVVMMFDRSWQEAVVLRSLVLLTEFLSSRQIKHLVFNLSTPFQELTNWPTLRGMQDLVATYNNIYLFDKTYYSTNFGIHKPDDYNEFGWQGHHGPEGNLHWYKEVILPAMIKANWLS